MTDFCIFHSTRYFYAEIPTFFFPIISMKISNKTSYLSFIKGIPSDLHHNYLHTISWKYMVMSCHLIQHLSQALLIFNGIISKEIQLRRKKFRNSIKIVFKNFQHFDGVFFLSSLLQWISYLVFVLLAVLDLP